MDGRSFGTHRLTGGRHAGRVLDVGGFKKARRGRLVVTVVSSGRPVRIDGIYAR